MKPLSSFLILQQMTAGNVSFSFTIPEALTRWKLMTLAHTKELVKWLSGKICCHAKTIDGTAQCTKIYEGRRPMEFSAKIVNLSDSEITGTANWNYWMPLPISR